MALYVPSRKRRNWQDICKTIQGRVIGTTMMTIILLVLKVLTCHETYFATDVTK